MVSIMRVSITFFLFIITLNVANSETVSYVEDRSGIVFLPEHNEPFSGKFVSLWDWGDDQYKGYGQHKVSGTYKNGKKDGVWTEWFVSGQKKSVTSYKEGTVNGKWIEWHTDGQKWIEASFVDGRADGLAKSWYADGTKKFEILFSGGVKQEETGLWCLGGRKALSGLGGLNKQVVGLTELEQTKEKLITTGIGFAYRARMRTKLTGFTLYPKAVAEEQQIQGKVLIGFVIDRKGMLVESEILQSSGHAALDQAVEQMIQMAQPFEPFPECSPDRVGFAFPFNVRLK